eukprot:310334_1
MSSKVHGIGCIWMTLRGYLGFVLDISDLVFFKCVMKVMKVVLLLLMLSFAVICDDIQEDNNGIESYLALAHSYLEPICEYNGQKRAELWDKKEPQKHDEIYSLLDSPQNTRYEWYQFINKSATSARE